MGNPFRDNLFRTDFDTFADGINSGFTTPNGFDWRRTRQWGHAYSWGIIPDDWDGNDVKCRPCYTNQTAGTPPLGVEGFQIEAATIPSGTSVDIAFTLVDTYTIDMTFVADYEWFGDIRTITLPNTPTAGDFWGIDVRRNGADNDVKYIGCWMEFQTV